MKLFRRRLPIVLQLSPAECGAACLTMILRYFGAHTSIAACREQVGGGQYGVTALMIANAARHYGLEVKQYRLTPADLARLTPPAILHWNGNHFVVLERWTPTQVDLVDPALGWRRLSAAEFAAGFSGITLTFAPGKTFNAQAPEHTPAPLWRAYLQQMLRIPGVRSLLGQIVLASFLLQALGLTLPFLTQVIVDRVLPARAANVMTLLGIGMALLVLAQVVMSYLRTVLVVNLQTRLDARLMLGFFEHLLALPYRFFQEHTSGDLLLRLDSNTLIRETLTSQVVTAILDGLLVVVYLCILFSLAPLFGLIVLALGLLQVGLLLSTTGEMHRLNQQHLAAQADSESYLVEALGGIETLKASGAETRVLEHWAQLFFKALGVALRRSQVAALLGTVLNALHNFAPVLLLWVGVYAVLAGQLSAGTMLALTILAASSLAPLSTLVWNAQSLQLVKAQLDRLAEVLQTAPERPLSIEPAPSGTGPAARLTGQIELRQVSFQYAPHLPLVLHNLSLIIQPGQKVAIVGRTGAGKSTLLRLLLGLYPPTAGEIYFDGVPMQAMNCYWLRSQCGVALQNPFILSGSIRENIAFNAPGLAPEQIIQAARQAALHDELMQLPMAYETRVAEGGSGLSGGQRQRLALARALAPQPAILLLDEATSHLDMPTEQVITANLNTLGCTRIVIAHRLGSVRMADRIVVLEHGKIVEQGPHAELLALGGVYTALMRNQVSDVEPGAH